MSDLKALFRGIAVLIDDEVVIPDSDIDLLAKQIEEDNCHVIRISSLPADEKLNALTDAAFFILDWNLHNVQADAGIGGDIPLVRTPQRLSKAHVQANIAFLKKIRERRFAPIFIFTNEDIESVKAELVKAGLFNDGPSDHIFVQGKKTVLEAGVFTILVEWIRKHPSAYVLKKWESAYASTRNSFFVDFYSLSHLWPVVLWKNYSDDNVSQAAELTSMIGRNIISRLAPVPFDQDIVAASEHIEALTEQIKPEEVKKVLEGERFIREARLQAEVSVGDVFKDKGKYFVNVRPECDCVARDGVGADEVELYLIRGNKVTDSSFHTNFNSTFGNFNDRDTNGTVFAMHEGVTVCFQFQDLHIGQWGDWRGKRIGRLIPPYSTRLQQRFGAFIQRIGLPRIPLQAVPENPLAGKPVAKKSLSKKAALKHKNDLTA